VPTDAVIYSVPTVGLGYDLHFPVGSGDRYLGRILQGAYL